MLKGYIEFGEKTVTARRKRFRRHKVSIIYMFNNVF